MTSQIARSRLPLYVAAFGGLLLVAGAALAQTPVDEDGNPIAPVYGDGYSEAAEENAEIELQTQAELEELVGPIALYPDDLLAVVLPASTYPLQVVEAARYLDAVEDDSSLKPDEDWDDSVVALLNYPEVLRMMSDDIDWTWQLGEAVVAQQDDVVAAVEAFRDRAYAAGNLKSDERQTVTRNDDQVIEIAPAEDDVIYVPYYEPEQVVVYQPRPVYYYYPTAYPVYYYPYPAGHRFLTSYFFGVTTAFRIGWATDHLHVYHHSFHGHPYFGWNYYGSYWRRPSITVFNTWYGNWGYRNAHDRYRYGSYWRPRHWSGARPGHYVTRNRYFTNRQRTRSVDGYADEFDRRDHGRAGRAGNRTTPIGNDRRELRDNRGGNDRPDRRAGNRRGAGNNAPPGLSGRDRDRGEIRFRPRDDVRDRGRSVGTRDRRINDDNGQRITVRRENVRGGSSNRAGAGNDRPRIISGNDNDRNRSTTPVRRAAPPSINRERRTTPVHRSAPQSVNRSRSTTPVRRAAPPSVDRSRSSTPVRRAAPPSVNRSRSTAPARRSAPASSSRSRFSAPSRPSSSSPSRSRSHSAPSRRPASSSSSRSRSSSGQRRNRNKH